MDHRFFQGDMGTGATFAFDIEAMGNSRLRDNEIQRIVENEDFFVIDPAGKLNKIVLGSLGGGKGYYGPSPYEVNEFKQVIEERIIKVGNSTLEHVLKPKGIVPLSESIKKDKILETYISMS